MLRKAVFACATVVTLGACAITPQQYETTPVIVDSAAGPVTCQLYTLEQVTWDRSINRPGSMSVATADNLCRQEGLRVMQGGTPNYATVSTTAMARPTDL